MEAGGDFAVPCDRFSDGEFATGDDFYANTTTLDADAVERKDDTGFITNPRLGADSKLRRSEIARANVRVDDHDFLNNAGDGGADRIE